MDTSKKHIASVNISEMDGIRYLHLGTPWVQGSMRIKQPFAIELDYVQRMMAWLLFFDLQTIQSRKALQLGLGAGTLTKSCYQTLQMNTTAIEINPAVISVCRQWFKLPNDGARLKVILGDAMSVLTQWERDNAASSDLAKSMSEITTSPNVSFDCIQVDLYDHDAAGPVLDSIEFYRTVRQLLSEHGVMTVNLFGRLASFEHSMEKIIEAFGNEALWCFSPTKEGNTVVLAMRHATSEHRPKREELLWRAQQIEEMFDLPAKKWLRQLKPLVKY